MDVINENWHRRFPQLAGSDDPAVRNLVGRARTVTLPAGTQLFRPGAACDNFLLLLDGDIRVYLTSLAGREVTLYRISGGDSCVLTTSCLLGNERYPALGITESDVTALAIDKRRFEAVMDASATFRQFVFSKFSGRLAELIQRMDAVTFMPIDQRLAEVLLRDAEAGRPTLATHQDLATELGTAREVVSRHLKRFESEGLIRIGRGRVTVLDRDALAGIRDDTPG